MNPDPKLTLTQARDIWSPGSSLTVYTVCDLRRQLLEQIGLASGLNLSLAAVTQCDCAGLQLLCAARRSAAAAHRPFVILDCSQHVRAAAEAVGLDPQTFLDPVVTSQP